MLKLGMVGIHSVCLVRPLVVPVADWFLCLFCTSVPSETAARIWDALLNEGTKVGISSEMAAAELVKQHPIAAHNVAGLLPQVLFRVALALLKLHEPLLLAQDNPGELLRATRRVAAEAFDHDALMQVTRPGTSVAWLLPSLASWCLLDFPAG
jgi:hypothetical protein